MTQSAAQNALDRFTDKLFHAHAANEIYDAALDAVVGALHCSQASILLLDADGVMRFVAWRGLSDQYRRAVEGLSPWAPGTCDPAPIYVDDIAQSAWDDQIKAVIRSENLAALAFIPLLADGKLIGKFMSYYATPHAFSAEETTLSSIIARQLGFGIERLRAEAVRREVEAQSRHEYELLFAELNHRIKNILATVIAIAYQSFSKKRPVAEAWLGFEERIQAMARAHDRLADRHSSGVVLRTIVDAEIAPYRNDHDNVRTNGADVLLTPKCALKLGMAFHELATNAAKYGALSNRRGVVEVSWQVLDAERELHVRWIESGGPPVITPQHSGFGRTMLERVLTAELSGKVQLDFLHDGLQCFINLPLDACMDAHSR